MTPTLVNTRGKTLAPADVAQAIASLGDERFPRDSGVWIVGGDFATGEYTFRKVTSEAEALQLQAELQKPWRKK